MLDPFLRPQIDRPLGQLASGLQRRGIGANSVTVTGFVFGLACMVAVALGAFDLALLALFLNRLADGLDGAIARIDGITDLGGFLDITLDFIFYSGFVFAFAVHDPQANALAATFLVFSFIGTGSSFLAFAIMAAKRDLSTASHGRKSIYFLGGLAEGTETLALFVIVCLWPSIFAPAAWIFGAICWLTTAGRIARAIDLLDG